MAGRTCALAVALGVAGCGGSSSSDNSGSSGSSGASTSTSSSSSSSSFGGGAAIALAADPTGKLAFDKTLTAKSGKVTIDFTNKSSLPHAVEVKGDGGQDRRR